MTYDQQLDHLLAHASIACCVCIGTMPNDAEFIPILPNATSDERIQWIVAKARAQGRGLRHVGVLGYVGDTAKAVLHEELSEMQVQALAEAFAMYVRCHLDDSVAWCEHLYTLEDTRLMN